MGGELRKMTDGDSEMNIRCLFAAGVIMLFGTAWAPFAWAKPEGEKVGWPDTRAGR